MCVSVCVEGEGEKEKNNERKGRRRKREAWRKKHEIQKEVRTSRDTIEVMKRTSADAKFESDPTYAIHTYQ